MPAQLAGDRLRQKLDHLFPNWERHLLSPDWEALWMEASGESERNARYMRDKALQLRGEDADAILHSYAIGEISRSECAWRLRDFMLPSLLARGCTPHFPTREELLGSAASSGSAVVIPVNFGG